ncbi:fatty acyl-AMP ligase [Streptosporangium sp. NPDC000239]|uniref:fatty acyl-AMP ligase n=1 Tax=Streptosporangium sp. NPDC000239 TaxID=3154248 RepID=UPI003325337A
MNGVTGFEGFMARLGDNAERFPDRRALVFCRDGGEEEVHTYRSLDLAARSVGAWLATKVTPGERVLLSYPSGLGFVTAFLGCLHAGAVAVPVPVPDTYRRQYDRVTAVCRDAEPALVLTDADRAEAVSAWISHSGLGVEVAVVGRGEPGRRAELSRDALAFLQYTSGSTSEAKGVMVRHGDLVDNILVGSRLLDLTEGPRFCSWLPVYHDMGLVAMILLPLYLGGTTVLMSPTDFLRRPWVWLDLIGKYGAEVSAAPNFAYDLCARRVTDQQVRGMDLSSWRHACNGAEPIDAGTLARFADRFAVAGLKPEALTAGYGMAEATLFISGTASGRPPVVTRADPGALARDTLLPDDAGRPLVSCGRPGVMDVRIVDPDTHAELPDGRVGEIWVRGDGVASGYWRKEEETRHCFGATTGSGESGFLRTGDLGVLADGELYVTGRIKDMVIVNGRNLYPHDIERAVAGLVPAMENLPSCVFSVTVPHEEIVIVQEIRTRAVTEETLTRLAGEIRSALGRRLGVTVANVSFVRPGAIPKTTSGKIRRGTTRELFVSGRLDARHEDLSAGVIGHHRGGVS